MSQGLGRWEERTTKSCSSFTLGCSSSSRSFQPGWLGLSPPRGSKPQSSSMSKSQPKRHQLGASKAGETQDVQLKPQVPPAWAVSSRAHRRRCQWRHKLPKFSAASQKQHSPEPVPLLEAHSEALRRQNWHQKWGWSFYFRMKGLGKAWPPQHKQCTTKRHIPDWIPPSLGGGIWVSPLGHVSLSPWALCLTRAPNAAPWKTTESSLGLLWFYY